MELKRIKIIGDGTSRGTKIIDAATGEKLSTVQKVEFSIEEGMVGLVRVTQLYKLDEIDVTALVPEDQFPPSVREVIVAKGAAARRAGLSNQSCPVYNSDELICWWYEGWNSEIPIEAPKN